MYKSDVNAVRCFSKISLSYSHFEIWTIGEKNAPARLILHILGFFVFLAKFLRCCLFMGVTSDTYKNRALWRLLGRVQLTSSLEKPSKVTMALKVILIAFFFSVISANEYCNMRSLCPRNEHLGCTFNVSSILRSFIYILY